MSAWSSPRTGCRPVPMGSWSAAARRPPAPPGSPTRRAPRGQSRSATIRADASASASARSCATTWPSEEDDHDDPFHPAGQCCAGGAVPFRRAGRAAAASRPRRRSGACRTGGRAAAC
ncbi:hypothetical protein G6F63_015217 [Rhizopus arrhizus]|nr:hypothetical protein G6F63_015217 [Rhizopus arrhizus]